MKVLTVGRGSKNDVVLNDSRVSRVHCQFVKKDDGTFTIVDFGSSNGTYVNGRRVVGEQILHRGDHVRVGGMDFNWEYYFESSVPKKNTSSGRSVAIIFAVFGGLIVLALVLWLLLDSNSKSNVEKTADKEPSSQSVPGAGARRFYIDGVSLGYDMKVDGIKKENPSASVVKMSTPGYEDNIMSQAPFTYYLINNNIAITTNQAFVNEINIWTSNYSTPEGIRVGSTWGDVVKSYPNVEFWCIAQWYCFEYRSYVSTIYLYDPETCTGFMFLESQFSASQLQAIHALVGGTDVGGEFTVEKMSASMYQSICSSVTVSTIIHKNCGGNTMASTSKPTLEPSREPAPAISTMSLSLELGETVPFTLSDGSKGTASLTTFGLGDLTLRINWRGENPISVEWNMDSDFLEPTSGSCSSKRNYDINVLNYDFSGFKWVKSDGYLNGVTITFSPK